MTIGRRGRAGAASAAGRKADGTERRAFFRVEDSVFLEFSVIERQRSDAEEADVSPAIDLYELCSSFATLSRTVEHDLKKLQPAQTVLANSIATVNRKLDQLVHHLVVQDHVRNGGSSHRVSVSAGGIVFLTDNPLRPGAELSLRLILGSAGSAIRTIGHVRRCRHRPHRFSRLAYQVAVEFAGLNEEQRTQIVRHVMHVQAEQRRNARWSRR